MEEKDNEDILVMYVKSPPIRRSHRLAHVEVTVPGTESQMQMTLLFRRMFTALRLISIRAWEFPNAPKLNTRYIDDAMSYNMSVREKLPLQIYLTTRKDFT